MNNQKEIQIAREIWNRLNQFSDLLWDRYEEDFLDIHLEQENTQFLHSLIASPLPDEEGKKLPQAKPNPDTPKRCL